MAAGGDGEDLSGAKNFYLQKFKLYETRSVSVVIFFLDFVLFWTASVCFVWILKNI